MVQDLQCVSYKEYITDLITDDAIEFLSDYTPKETALILSICLHYTAPHDPYVGADGLAESIHPKEIVGLYDNASFVSCRQEPANPHSIGWYGWLTRLYLENRECLKGYYAAV